MGPRRCSGRAPRSQGDRSGPLRSKRLDLLVEVPVPVLGHVLAFILVRPLGVLNEGILVRILYDSTGGSRHYSRQPDAVKYICSGLKRSLILKKFRTVAQLRKHLETMEM